MPEETLPTETQFAPAASVERRSVGAAERAQILLEVTRAVVSNLSLRDLLLAVSACLKQFFKHDFASIVLYEEGSGQLRVHALDVPSPAGAFNEGSLLPLEGTPAGLAIKTRRTVLRERLDLNEFNSPQARAAYEVGVRCGCSVPLISHDRVLGTINLGSLREAAFTEADAELLRQLADPVAIAVENALNFEHATKERERAETLLQVNNAITTSLNLRELLRATSDCLRRYFKHDFAGMALYDAESDQLRVHALDLAQPLTQYVDEGFLMPLEGSPAGLAFTTRHTVLVERLEDWEPSSPVVERALAVGIRSSCNAPLVFRDRPLGSVVVASRREEAFTEEDAELLGLM